VGANVLVQSLSGLNLKHSSVCIGRSSWELPKGDLYETKFPSCRCNAKVVNHLLAYLEKGWCVKGGLACRIIPLKLEGGALGW